MATIIELKERFEITHTGNYKTRDGRKALVSYIDPDESIYVIWGVIEGEMHSRIWTKKGELLTEEENPEDIVAEWED